MDAKLLTADRFVDVDCGCSYRYVQSETEYFRLHYHDYYELFLMLDGSCYHMANGVRHQLKKGALVFIRPSDVHDYATVDGKSFSFLNVTFTDAVAAGLFGYLGDGFPAERLKNAVEPPTVQLSERRLNMLTEQMDGVCAISLAEKSRWGTALRVFLFRAFTHCFGEYTEAESALPPWLEKLCDQMQRDGNFLGGTQRLFSLADKSREHVCRCMKQYTGRTVTEFVNDLRLQYAANMLLNSNHSVTQIILESGFTNGSWAAAQFKKRMGVTMSEYRRTQREFFIFCPISPKGIAFILRIC